MVCRMQMIAPKCLHRPKEFVTPVDEEWICYDPNWLHSLNVSCAIEALAKVARQTHRKVQLFLKRFL